MKLVYCSPCQVPKKTVAPRSCQHEGGRAFPRVRGSESNDERNLWLCSPLYQRHLPCQWGSLLAEGVLRTWRQRFHICVAFWSISVLAALDWLECALAGQSQMNSGWLYRASMRRVVHPTRLSQIFRSCFLIPHKCSCKTLSLCVGSSNVLAEPGRNRTFLYREGSQTAGVLTCSVGKLDTGRSWAWQREHQDETAPIIL